MPHHRPRPTPASPQPTAPAHTPAPAATSESRTPPAPGPQTDPETGLPPTPAPSPAVARPGTPTPAAAPTRPNPRPTPRTATPPTRRDPRRPGGLRGPGPRPGESRAKAVRPKPPRPPAGTAPGAAVPRPVRAPQPHEVFARRLLAVLTGERPVHWMLGHTVGEAYEQLVRLAPANPLRAAGNALRADGRAARPAVRHCRAAPLRPGVVEAFASVVTGDRVRAMAFRLEQGPDHKWRCAAVELGTEPARRPAPYASTRPR